MLAYGYYGDILLDSEKSRWLGPKRYHIAGSLKSVNRHKFCSFYRMS